MTRIAIGIPSNRGISTPTVQTILATAKSLERHGIKTECFFSNANPVDLARAIILADALATTATHLLWLDDDISCPAETIRGMIDADAPAVYVPYALRGLGGRLDIQLEPGAKPFLRRGQRFMPIALGGLGCALFTRAALETVIERYPTLRAYPGTRDRTLPLIFHTSFMELDDGAGNFAMHFVGEDYALALRLTDSGIKLLALLGQEVTHAGAMTRVNFPDEAA